MKSLVVFEIEKVRFTIGATSAAIPLNDKAHITIESAHPALFSFRIDPL
jgi:hypothetical protein